MEPTVRLTLTSAPLRTASTRASAWIRLEATPVTALAGQKVILAFGVKPALMGGNATSAKVSGWTPFYTFYYHLSGCCIGTNKYLVFNSKRSIKDRGVLKMFPNVTDFFGVYKSDNTFDSLVNERMVFKKVDDSIISKVIRFDKERKVWIASNEVPGTIPKPFWYSKSSEQCLAKSQDNENNQIW